MTWPEIHQLLFETHHTVEERCATTLPPASPRPRADDFALQQAVEAHCRTFAETQAWPDSTPEVCRAALPRLEQAVAFSDFVACMDIARPPTIASTAMFFSDATLLRWLLIDYWYIAGLWRHVYRLQEPPG